MLLQTSEAKLGPPKSTGLSIDMKKTLANKPLVQQGHPQFGKEDLNARSHNGNGQTINIAHMG